MAGALIGGAILALAAAVLIRRLAAFFRTKGQSACANCPYSGVCQKHSCGRTRGK